MSLGVLYLTGLDKDYILKLIKYLIVVLVLQVSGHWV